MVDDVVDFYYNDIFYFTTASVGLAWNQSISTNVVGNKIYWGVSSGVYINFVTTSGYTTTNVTITGLVEGTTYYFAATAVDWLGNESPFSNEISYSVPTNSVATNIVYIGIKVDYGTDIISLNSKLFEVLQITNDPGYFYGEYLIITNNPFIGTHPSDTNQYVYIGTLLQYGTGLASLNSTIFPLTTFTNLPGQYYRW